MNPDLADLVSIVDIVDHAIRQGELLPHQRAALEAHDRAITNKQRHDLTEDWRAEGSPAAPRPLAVPYFSQRDSATGQGERMCFSSTCAMAAAFLKPNSLAGPGQPDDRYLALVQRFGDTTDASAQVRALQSLGINARFRQDGDFHHLARQVALGIPVPVGWLHHGPVSAPRGGGHWTLAIGWDATARQVIMHDPYGEANLVGGGYVSTAIGSGKGQRYSEQNWGRRWMAGPGSSYRFTPGTGWWLELSN
jgi:hypothetical protein